MPHALIAPWIRNPAGLARYSLCLDCHACRYRRFYSPRPVRSLETAAIRHMVNAREHDKLSELVKTPASVKALVQTIATKPGNEPIHSVYDPYCELAWAQYKAVLGAKSLDLDDTVTILCIGSQWERQRLSKSKRAATWDTSKEKELERFGLVDELRDRLDKFVRGTRPIPLSPLYRVQTEAITGALGPRKRQRIAHAYALSALACIARARFCARRSDLRNGARKETARAVDAAVMGYLMLANDRPGKTLDLLNEAASMLMVMLVRPAVPNMSAIALLLSYVAYVPGGSLWPSSLTRMAEHIVCFEERRHEDPYEKARSLLNSLSSDALLSSKQDALSDLLEQRLQDIERNEQLTKYPLITLLAFLSERTNSKYTLAALILTWASVFSSHPSETTEDRRRSVDLLFSLMKKWANTTDVDKHDLSSKTFFTQKPNPKFDGFHLQPFIREVSVKLESLLRPEEYSVVAQIWLRFLTKRNNSYALARGVYDSLFKSYHNTDEFPLLDEEIYANLMEAAFLKKDSVFASQLYSDIKSGSLSPSADGGPMLDSLILNNLASFNDGHVIVRIIHDFVQSGGSILNEEHIVRCIDDLAAQHPRDTLNSRKSHDIAAAAHKSILWIFQAMRDRPFKVLSQGKNVDCLSMNVCHAFLRAFNHMTSLSVIAARRSGYTVLHFMIESGLDPTVDTMNLVLEGHVNNPLLELEDLHIIGLVYKLFVEGDVSLAGPAERTRPDQPQIDDESTVDVKEHLLQTITPNGQTYLLLYDAFISLAFPLLRKQKDVPFGRKRYGIDCALRVFFECIRNDVVLAPDRISRLLIGLSSVSTGLTHDENLDAIHREELLNKYSENLRLVHEEYYKILERASEKGEHTPSNQKLKRVTYYFNRALRDEVESRTYLIDRIKTHL